jgi:hypothetical protein
MEQPSLLQFLKSGFREGFSFGHSAFGAGVTVTIVEASNVGVKVGMVGRGVMVGVNGVGVGVGEKVAVTVGMIASVAGGNTDGVQAFKRKIAIRASR